jgi:hypothetical protein
VRLNQDATATWHQDPQQLLEETIRVGQVMKDIDGVDAACGAIRQRHVHGIQMAVDVGRASDISGHDLRSNVLEKACTASEFDLGTLALEMSIARARHFSVEIQERTSQETLLLKYLAVDGQKKLVIDFNLPRSAVVKHTSENVHRELSISRPAAVRLDT